jgi:hypothetical protein
MTNSDTLLIEELRKDSDEKYKGEVFDYPDSLPIMKDRGSKPAINRAPAKVLDEAYEYAIPNKGYKIEL